MRFSYKNIKNPKTCRHLLLICNKLPKISKEQVREKYNIDYYFESCDAKKVDEVIVNIITDKQIPDSIMGMQFAAIQFLEGTYSDFVINYCMSRWFPESVSTYYDNTDKNSVKLVVED
jgi:hypothetical protein